MKNSDEPIRRVSICCCSTVATAGRLPLTAAYFGAFTTLGLSVGSLGPTLPGLADQANVGLSAIGYLFTARSLGYVFGSFRGGKLFDHKSGNPVMAAMLGVLALAMAVVPMTPAFGALLAPLVVAQTVYFN